MGGAVRDWFLGRPSRDVDLICPDPKPLAARLAAEAPRQIANAHTIFNIANTVIFIGFTTLIARLVEWLVPDRPLDEEAAIRPRFLDEDLLRTPSLALEQVRLEIDDDDWRRLGSVADLTTYLERRLSGDE